MFATNTCEELMILYLSCHSILEYDELKLFEEIGIEYFSLGSYIIPNNPADPIRPPLAYHPPDKLYQTPAPQRNQLTAEFIEPFDTIVAMHVPEWITENWEVIKNKRVIWRSIGQSDKKTEAKLAPYREHIEVIRYSPREIFIENNIGADEIIRFYKDPKEFYNWNGGGTEVVTFAQNFKHRGEHLNYDVFLKLSAGFNTTVYGPKNEDMGPMNGGFLTYQEMKQKMRDARVYIYTGTQPASYTLTFIEAMMTGTPTVALGPAHGNSLKIAGEVYEVPDIIIDGINGFVSDDLGYLRQKVNDLVHDKALANRISTQARKTAIKYFGKNNIKEQWRQLLCK